MRKKSDIAAAKVGKLVLGLGFIAAALSPFAGAVLAGWSTGAAALGGLGLGAAAPLAAAGAFGGFILGAIAAPFIAIGSLAVAGVAAIGTKAIGSGFEWMFSSKNAAPVPSADVQRQIVIDPAGSRLNKLKLGTSFDAALARKPSNANKPAPQLKMLPRPSF